MHKNTASLEFWSEELEYSKLPDERFRSNLVKMCHSLQEKPEHSFSSACGEVVRKSAHRLFSKEESIDIQLGHRHKTLERCKNHNRILVIEDTADLNYSSHKSTKGLGGLGGKNTKGLNIHSAMVLTTEAEPLGLIGQYIWAPRASGRKKKNHNYSIQEKESFKWIRTKNWVNEWFEDYHGQVIVVGDREADFYEHFSWSRKQSIELLIRAQHLNRNIFYKGNKTKVSKIPELVEELGKLEVTIPRQKNRKKRKAQLSLRVAKIEYPPAYHKKGKTHSLTLVHVKEIEKEGIKSPVE